MTAYRERLRLRVRHGYYAATAPVRVQLRAPLPVGWILRAVPAGATLIAPAADAEASVLRLAVVAADARVQRVTAAPATTQFECAPTAAAPAVLAAGAGASPAADPEFARIVVRLAAAEATPALVELRLAALRTVWAYHVIGGDAEAPLAVRDAAGATDFAAEPAATLPDGRALRVFRAAHPLPLAERGPHRFELVRHGPFGARTLLAPLPVPGPSGLQPGRPAPDTPLQSNIFVAL